MRPSSSGVAACQFERLCRRIVGKAIVQIYSGAVGDVFPAHAGMIPNAMHAAMRRRWRNGQTMPARARSSAESLSAVGRGWTSYKTATGLRPPLQSGKTRRGRTMREVTAYKGKDGGMVEFAEAK